MLISSIIPTQNDLRNIDQISKMVLFVREGGFFDAKNLQKFAEENHIRTAPIIKIARFEDGKLFLHDGHHRVCSILLGNRDFLEKDEFFVEDWFYADYMSINLEQKWYTVFDPRKEVRIADISKYKKMVDDFLKKSPKPDFDQIKSFIFNCYESRLYVETRSATSIAEMIEKPHFSRLKTALVERSYDMSNYRQNTQSLSKKAPTATAQTVQTPGTVENNAGGFVYELDKWDRLNRFLILGSDSATYYASAKTLSIENAKCVLECAKEDGIRLVKTIVDISHSGRAIKNTPALFALAIAASVDDVSTKREALRSLSKVARTGTHLFEFANFVDGQRGWGYSLRNAFNHWYNDMDADRLAHQVVKYPQRVTEEGNAKSSWSHDDLLRKCHPNGDANHNAIYEFVTKEGKLPKKVPSELKILQGANEIKQAKSAKEVAALVEKYELPHELVPKEFANEAIVWEALLPHMPITATLRTLNRLTSYGVLKPLSSNLKTVVDRLLNVEQIKKGRVHPISVLSALKTYAQGHGTKGSLSWTPVARINDALNEMLYLAFDQVEPTGKNLLLGFDISGSMDSSFISNLGISAREAAAVMGMVTARAEKNHYAIGFTSSGGYYSRGDYGVTALDISPRDRLDVVVQKMQKMPMGGTDCALAVMHALKNKLDVDGFVVYTDNETYAGSIKVDEALKRYRKEMNKPTAKLIAVGMTATQYSIVDDKDRYCMNVVGFDTAAPAVISDFMRQK